MSTVTTIFRAKDAHADVEFLTVAKTLTDSDSGKVFVFNANPGAAITLPALKKGLYFKFITGLAFDTTAWTIVCPSAIGKGGAIVNSTFVACASKQTITVAHAAETVGDYIELTCDGTSYFVSGVGAAAGAYTFA